MVLRTKVASIRSTFAAGETLRATVLRFALPWCFAPKSLKFTKPPLQSQITKRQFPQVDDLVELPFCAAAPLRCCLFDRGFLLRVTVRRDREAEVAAQRPCFRDYSITTQ